MSQVTTNPDSVPLAAGGQAPALAPPVAKTRISRRIAPSRRGQAGPPHAPPPQGGSQHPFQHSPPWLVSAAFHMVLLVTLGLWFFSTGSPQATLELRYSDRLGQQLDELSIATLADDERLEEEVVVTPDDLQPVEDPFAAPQLIELGAVPTTATHVLSPRPLGMALSGREEGTKKALLAAYGGDATTEAAVLEALRWLARNQRPGGLWSLSGPYLDGANVENRKAATAMALLAFQGAGYTHQGDPAEPFSRVVARGWNALLEEQAEDGSFLGEFYHHRLYTHAQCTIALCELYAMTGDESLREPAERAVAYCLLAQSPEGGWRYDPGQGSDLSVTGWFVMALKSAQIAGLEVPSATFLKVEEFLDRVAVHGGARYSYRPGDKDKRSMTAEGLLCRQYLGWRQDDPRLVEGAEHLLDNPVRWDEDNCDVYYWYYATQVCHHIEGDYWKKWNAQMKRVLPGEQVKTGRERGSWDPTLDPYGFQAGRLYVTCLSTYMLEVYYRHLPLYRQDFTR